MFLVTKVRGVIEFMNWNSSGTDEVVVQIKAGAFIRMPLPREE
jgi:hypothetical protein